MPTPAQRFPIPPREHVYDARTRVTFVLADPLPNDPEGTVRYVVHQPQPAEA